jgi:hypothetical protein
MSSRRKILAAVAGLPLLTAGCLEPESESRGALTTAEPIFESNQDRWDESPYVAEVFSDPGQASDVLNTEVIRKNDFDHFLEFDGDDQLLSVLAPRLDFTPGATRGWCPKEQITDDEIIFRLPIEDQPDELEEPYVNSAVVILWSRNFGDVPSEATVEIQSVPEDDDTKSCSD